MDVLTVLFDMLLAAVSIISWKSYFFPSQRLRPNRRQAILWCLFMGGCAAAIYTVLLHWSARDVRDDPGALTAYFFFSLFLVIVVQISFEFLGVSFRDDVVERKNRSAAFTIAGLTVGVTCCVAGSNVGDGPGPEVVLFSAAISIGALLVFWGLVATIGNTVEAVTIERDGGAGLRSGALLAASGGILGASVAGDWVSLPTTLRDFARFVWPFCLVLVALIFLERQLNRREIATRLSVAESAIISAAVMVLAGAYAVWVAKQ